MNASIEKLLAHWRSMDLKIPFGNSPAAISDFETRHRVVLPDDFREYFRAVDGMSRVGGPDCDKDGFSFWQLEKVRPVSERVQKHKSLLLSVEEPDHYFLFADYLQWSWAYAIRLGSNATHDVILVGTRKPQKAAATFSEFLELYFRDSQDLYPAMVKHRSM
jgi:hypothetical protein